MELLEAIAGHASESKIDCSASNCEQQRLLQIGRSAPAPYGAHQQTASPVEGFVGEAGRRSIPAMKSGAARCSAHRSRAPSLVLGEEPLGLFERLRASGGGPKWSQVSRLGPGIVAWGGWARQG